MLKRVLFLFAIGMLMLMPALGCASTSSNEAQQVKPVIYSFAAVSQTVQVGQAPQFVYKVGNTKSITITAPDGSVVAKETIPATRGVYPANFKGAKFGDPAKLVNKFGSSETQIFTLTAANDDGQATATCSVTVVPATQQQGVPTPQQQGVPTPTPSTK
jgi:hypothetical protein